MGISREPEVSIIKHGVAFRLPDTANGSIDGELEGGTRAVEIEFFLTSENVHILHNVVIMAMNQLNGVSGIAQREEEHAEAISSKLKTVLNVNESSGGEEGRKVKLTLSSSGTSTSSDDEKLLNVKLEANFLKDVLTKMHLEGCGEDVRLMLGIALAKSSLCEAKYGGKSKLPSEMVELFTALDDRQTNEMEITLTPGETPYCEGQAMFPLAWREFWLAPVLNLGCTYSANMCIRVKMFKRKPVRFSPPLDTADLYKQLLSDQEGTDLKIIPGRGSMPVKCHGAVVLAQSRVFQDMQQQQLSSQENDNTEIKLMDMSDAGVKALLAFLYGRNMVESKKNIFIAVELFKAAINYSIPSLEDGMKAVLMTKPDGWYKVDAVVDLFYFVNKIDRHYDLKIQCLKILNGKSEELNKVTSGHTHERVDNPDEEKELDDALLQFNNLALMLNVELVD